MTTQFTDASTALIIALFTVLVVLRSVRTADPRQRRTLRLCALCRCCVDIALVYVLVVHLRASSGSV